MISRKCRAGWGAFVAIGYTLAATAHAAGAQEVRAQWDWNKKVFVQEYWHDGSPHYAIANLRDDDIAITIKPVHYEHDVNGRAFLVAGAPVAGPLAIPAQSTMRIDADNMVGDGGLSFVMEGFGEVGVIPAPKFRDAEFQAYLQNRFTDHRIRIFDGVNGMGGQRTGIWTEQTRRVFKGGDMATLELHVRRGIDRVVFNRAPQEIDRGRAIRWVPLYGAVSDTLPVNVNPEAIVIHARQPLAQRPEHTATLTLSLPAVQRPTMVIYNATVYLDNGSSYELTRGLLVEPNPTDNF